MDWTECFNGGEEFDRFLQELIDDGEISGPMIGMARKVIRDGVGSLNSGQAFIFKRDLIDRYKTACKCCQDELPWNEVQTARMFNDGYCGRCAYRMDKELHSEMG